MYNSLAEYACMPNGGALPDATLYFNTDVTITSDSYINRTNTGGWALPGVACNPDATTGTLCPSVVSTNTGKVTIGIGGETTSKKYKATLFLSAKTSSSTATQFSVVANSFESLATTKV